MPKARPKKPSVAAAPPQNDPAYLVRDNALRYAIGVAHDTSIGHVPKIIECAQAFEAYLLGEPVVEVHPVVHAADPPVPRGES